MSNLFPTALGTRQLVRWYDPSDPSNSFTPRLNPVTLQFKPGNVRKYAMTTNGTSIILGQREYPPQEIALSWSQLDITDYEGLKAFTNVAPVVYVDNNDNGFLGLLIIDSANQLPSKTMNVWAVKAAFLSLKPYDGQHTTLNRLAVPTLTVTGNTSGGYIPPSTDLYFWASVWTPWGESTPSSVYSVTTPGNTLTPPSNPIPLLSPPAAPTIQTVTGGTLSARTYYAKWTYLTENGETLASVEASEAIAANYLFKSSSPATIAGAVNYNIYISTTTGTETLQNTSPVAIGTAWTEPSTGLIAGANPPASNTAIIDSEVAGGSLALRTYYVKWTLTTPYGETTPSAEVVQTGLKASFLFQSPSVASVPGASGYNFYASTTSGSETLQNSAPIPLGNTWTEPNTGLITTGAAPPSSNTAQANIDSISISWTNPSSSYYRKLRLYWNTSNNLSTATMLTDMLYNQGETFVVYAPYAQYNQLTPAEFNTALTGYWAGSLWVQDT